MEQYLKEQCEWLRNAVKDDFDAWIIIDGEIEGSGKSFLGAQIAYELDPTIDVERICFSNEQFMTAINNAKKGQAIIWDEASEGTNSNQAVSRLNNTLQRASEQIRQKNLFIILIRPSYFDFSKYFAIHRSWFLITVGITYDEDNKRIKRGFYRFYSRSRKKRLYLLGKKTMDRFVVKENFRGRFPNQFPMDYKAYKKKKSEIKDLTKDNVMPVRDLLRQIKLHGWRAVYIDGMATVAVPAGDVSELSLSDRLKLMENVEVPT